jgi:ELWxxDGT repeat protein
LWVTTGAKPGTRAVADIHTAGDARPTQLTSYHGKAVFAADDGQTGREPWVSTGRHGGTRRILDVRPGPRGSAPREMTSLVFNRFRWDTGR